MPNLTPSADLVTNSAFLNKVTSAIVSAALAISGEQPDPALPTKAYKRQRLATMVLESPQREALRFGWAIAVNPVIASGGIDDPGLDNNIEYVVTQVWDDLAGVTYNDTQPAPEPEPEPEPE